MDKRASHGSDKDLLEYYHSPLAGQGHCYQLARHSRQLSIISSSSSDYSCLSDSKDATSSDASSQVTRRSSTPSVGSADRRRVAIVEMDPPAEEDTITASQTLRDPSNTLRSKRGLHSSLSGLAIVTPPDSSHKSFVLLSPTIPLTATLTDRHTPQEPASIASHHQRSTSDILPRKKIRSRDIGIVGTAQLTSPGTKQGTKPDKSLPDMYTPDNNKTTLHPPIFQQPKSSTPSPEPFQELSLPVVPAPIHSLKIMKREKSKELLATHPSPAKNPASSLSPQLTPELRAEKDVSVPVAPTITVGLDSATDADAVVGGIRLVSQPKAPVPNPTNASSTTSPPILVLPTTDSTLSYVNYQPGIHSTAGPLPPPPRLPGFDGLAPTPTSPPPPRPPRLNSPLPPRNAARSKDIEAVKQALQLPPSVSAALASKVLIKSEESLKKDTMAESRGSNNSHALGPAVAASSTSNSTISSPSLSDMSTSSYSVSQNFTPVHRREGAFPTPTSDVGSLDSERHPEKDATSRRTPLVSSTTDVGSTAPGQVKGDEEEVPQVTIISEPPPPPSPIPEEPTVLTPAKGDNDVDSLLPRHRRERGQVIVTSDNENDSNENWVAISRTSSPSSHHDRSTLLDNNGTDRESSKTPSEAPSPPPKSFRNSLTTGLKRFSSRSLPRTPSVSPGGSRRSSVMSKRFSAGSSSLVPLSGTAPISTTASLGGSVNGSRNGSATGSGLDVSNAHAERIPSPLPQVPSIPRRAATVLGHALPNVHGHSTITGYSASLDGHGVLKSTVRKRQKAVVQWPSAMFCNEIHATNGRKKLSSSEKCAIYAQKINELYMYDCGLTEWVVEMKFRGPNSNPGSGSTSKKFLDTRSPASAPFTPQPRQTSRSSIISNATFPTRPDATTATDLLSSSHDHDGVYHEDVPPLPYPSLATAQRAAASNVASIASPPTSNAALMTSPASLRSSGSNITLPPMGAGSANTSTHTHLTHTPASTLTSLTNPSTPASPTTVPLSPIPSSVKHPVVTSLSSTPSTSGFFATLGRKTSLSSGKRPNLGLGLSNLISSSSSLSSSSPSGGLSPLTSSHRLLTKSISISNSGGTKLPTSTTPKSPVVGGLQMNTASPPSVVPGGPRALMNNSRVQRSKTFIPSTNSPFNGYGGGLGSRSGGGGVGAGGIGGSGGGNQYGGNIERRPSLWELQLNSTNSISDGMTTVAPINSSSISGSNTHMPHSHSFSSQTHPYANPLTTAGYVTDSSQLTHHHSQPYTPTTVQYNQSQLQQQTTYDPQLDPEFIRQVDKLADLLPHADRKTLAGYLRRAGQDVLAIGQYLEDEKNGTLKAH